MKRFIASALLGLGFLSTGLAPQAKADNIKEIYDPASQVRLVGPGNDRGYQLYSNRYFGQLWESSFRWGPGMRSSIQTFGFGIRHGSTNEGCIGRARMVRNTHTAQVTMMFDGTMYGATRCLKAGGTETYSFNTPPYYPDYY